MYFLLYFLCVRVIFYVWLDIACQIIQNEYMSVTRHDIFLYISVIFRANIYVSYRVSQRALFSRLRLINGIMRSRCTLLWIHTEKCFLPYFIIACVWHEAYNIHVDYQICLLVGSGKLYWSFQPQKFCRFNLQHVTTNILNWQTSKMLSRENLWVLHSSKLRK